MSEVLSGSSVLISRDESQALRMRGSIEAARFAGLGERTVTVTIGVAEHGKGEKVAALLARADRALYQGKSSGRNRVVTG